MKKLLIIFLLFAATASANVIRPVEPSAAENNMVRLSRIIIDPERLEEYNAYLKEEIEVSMRLTGRIGTVCRSGERTPQPRDYS